MDKKLTKEDIIELTHKRYQQMTKNYEVPEVAKNFIIEFAELGKEIKEESAEDFITVYLLEEVGFYQADIKLLGDGIRLKYSHKANVIDVSLTDDKFGEHLINILRIDGNSVISSYTNKPVTPYDILSYFKSTDSYRNLTFLTNEY